VRVKSLLGHYVISMPFLNDGGPLGDADAQLVLVEHAVALTKEWGAELLELRSRGEVPGPVTPANRKITVMLPLPASPEVLWEKTIKAKLRSQIRKPTKEGMTFREGAGELGNFYGVFARNMRDLGTPVLPIGFFETASRELGESMVFATVYAQSGTPVASACCLVWRDEMEITWASSLREFNHQSPNMLLYFRLMEIAVARGIPVFNFGRCTPGGTTHRFKQQWGGSDVALPWPAWYRNPDAGVPTADSGMYRLAIAVWQRLPLAVANGVGSRISRLFP
jgi:FemAB-related protein (PEP-CTERM system-associated)